MLACKTFTLTLDKLDAKNNISSGLFFTRSKSYSIDAGNTILFQTKFFVRKIIGTTPAIHLIKITALYFYTIKNHL